MRPSTDSVDGERLDSKAIKANLLRLLEERQRQAELWLQSHHETLREAIEAALPGPEVWPQEPLETVLPELDAGNLPSADKNPSGDKNPSEQAGGGMTPEDQKACLSKASTVSINVSRQQGQSSMWEKFSQEKKTTLLESGTAVLIVVNTLVMYVQLELEGRKSSAILYDEEVPDNTVLDVVFLVLNHIFNAIFVFELLGKIYIYKGQYFRSAFDLFDFVIVIVTSIDLYIITTVSNSTGNISFLRTMRLLRLARLLRIIRMMNIFQQLRVLMHTMVLSFLSVFWSMLVLLLFMLVSSLLLSQTLQDFITNGSEEQNITRVWAERYYGTSSKSLYTVFEMTFSGCWPTYARVLIEKVSPMYLFFFIPYVTLVIFTLIRLIYALLLKDTLQAAANDANLVVQDKMKEAKGLIKKLSDLFAEADVGQSGYLGREEFDRILAYPRVQTWMSALGVNTQDTEQLFSILDDGENPDGKISRKAFVNGIMRMKGHAQKQDLLVSARDTHRILDHCKVLEAEVVNLRSLLCNELRPSCRLSTIGLTPGTLAAASI